MAGNIFDHRVIELARVGPEDTSKGVLVLHSGHGLGAAGTAHYTAVEALAKPSCMSVESFVGNLPLHDNNVLVWDGLGMRTGLKDSSTIDSGQRRQDDRNGFGDETHDG